MERVRRRWWTWTVSVVAVLVILAATVSALFQAAVLALPSYRDDLSAWVTKVAGRPVDIGGINLVWHGIYPRIDLSDITLYSDDGQDEEVLSAQRLSLGFNLLNVATGDFTPTRIELSGLDLGVNVDEDGKVTVVGLEQNTNQKTDYEKLLREVSRFKRVRLSNCHIELSAPYLPEDTVNVTLASVEVSHTSDGLAAEAELLLPAAYGKTVDLDAEVEGPITKPASWSGEFNVSANQLQPEPWLHKLLLPGTRLAVEGGSIDLHGSLQAGRVTKLEARGESDAVAIARAGRDVTAKSLKFLAQAASGDDGWQLDIKKFQIDGDDQLRGALHYAASPQADGYDLKADADYLNLNRLMPWLGYFRNAPKALSMASRSSGEIDRVVLRMQQGAEDLRYSLLATLKEVGLKPGDGAVGFSGLSGELSADENSGHFKLTGSSVTLDLPHALRNAVPFDRLTGEARWNRRAEGWQFDLPAFGWKMESILGNGQVSLLLPSEEDRSPELNLSASFSVGEVTQAKPFMPLAWHDDLYRWLNRAIVGGRIPHAQLEFHGALADFPFQKRANGSWKLDLDVINANLAYLPDWPSIEQIKAHLSFAGNGLSIQAESGNVLGNTIDKGSARFVDFNDGMLVVDVAGSGDASRFYDFMLASPLKKTLAGLVNNTTAKGPSQVAVHLNIPLHDGNKTEVAGAVVLNGVELRYKGLQDPVREISGNLNFSNTGVTADKLTAKFEDIDLAAKILPRANTYGVVAADFPYALKADGSGISAFVPDVVRKTISGGSRWSLELPIGKDETALHLLTDLQGVTVAMPQPLGKSPEEIVPLNLVIGGAGTNATATHVRVDYRDRLNTDIALTTAADGNQRVRGINLHLGHGTAPQADGDGMNISGDVDAIDLAAWGGVLGQARGSGMTLHRAELHAARVTYMGQAVRDVHAVMIPNPDGWTTKLDGGGAEGDLVWRDAGSGALSAQLKRLAVDFQSGAIPASVTSNTPDKNDNNIFDPNQFPLLDIACDQLNVSGFDFGKLSLLTSRVPGGQKTERLNLSGGKTTLTADGWWKRERSLSSAALKFDLSSEDSAGTLKALGYAPNLDSKQGKINSDLSWTAEPSGISWAQARGKVGIDIKEGSLRAIEPGAGRVLGLLNFYALPKRFSLDFHDVVSSGLGFDTIKGNYDLANGIATTNDLDIKGSSLAMEVRGKIGLAARDFDQKITVHPSISTGVAIGATIVGGPAAGALVLLAQQVLGKPLDKLTQFSYHLTGPWDNPKVE